MLALRTCPSLSLGYSEYQGKGQKKDGEGNLGTNLRRPKKVEKKQKKLVESLKGHKKHG